MAAPTLQKLDWELGRVRDTVSELRADLDELKPDAVNYRLDALEKKIDRWGLILGGGLISVIGVLVGAVLT